LTVDKLIAVFQYVQQYKMSESYRNSTINRIAETDGVNRNEQLRNVFGSKLRLFISLLTFHALLFVREVLIDV